MQKYNVVISDTAERDLLCSYYYIYFELENPMAAEKFKNALQSKIKSLSEAPFMGEPHETLANCRVVHALKYRIFYVIDEAAETVAVLRIFYTKRQDPSLREL